MTSIDQLLDEARRFLDAHYEPKPQRETPFVWGEGSDCVAMLEESNPENQAERIVAAKQFAAARFDAGFGWIEGPVEYGGRGLTIEHAQAYQELEQRYEVPHLGIIAIATGFIAPAVRAHSSPEIRREYLPKMYRGDLIVCQLFSEPNAGSDLASAATRAVRDGDEWVITGQKVWTSNANIADVALAVCRTDLDVPKHQGLTTFLVDMHAPGVEVRPLRQMTGGAGFNEVFLTDVRVPDTHRVGALNAGFGVILTTLGNERTMGTKQQSFAPGHGPFERLIGVVEHFGDRHDPITRQRLAALYIGTRVKDMTAARALGALKPGETPGPGASMLKLLGTKYNHTLTTMLTEILGMRLAADTGQWGTFAWNDVVLAVPGGRIGGGTEEIVRNTLGEKVLGLPKEPKVVAPRS